MWTQKQKDRVMRDFRGWLDYYGIPMKEINYIWREKGKGDEEGDVQFEVSSGYPYMNCSLISYPIAQKDTDDGVELGIIHECNHLALAPLVKNRLMADSIFSDFEEATVEHYTRWTNAIVSKCRDLEAENDRLIKENKKLVHKTKRKDSNVK